METSKIEIFFTGLFPTIVLKNTIVATIIYNIGLKLNVFKTEIDNTINTDI